jgi:5-methylcytosine-specific restriction endonuclease McrA
MKEAARRKVWQRAENRCEYCGMHQDHEPFYRFHVEHVIAKQHGGGDGLANLALACHHCNHHKGTNLSGIDPRTGNIVPLFHPRRQRWDRHFRTVGARVVGRTQCGRATIALLRMNMRDRVDLREEL